METSMQNHRSALLFIVAGTLLVLLAFTGTSGPGHNILPVPRSHLIFSDSFSSGSLSSAWTIVNRHGEYAQYETECNVPGAVSVANYLLTITTTAQSATCGDFNLDRSVRHSPTTWPYTTGDVQWTSLAFTYGTISYRAKFPPQNTGTWPAIWLLGSNCQATNIVTADTGYSTCPAIYSPGYVEIDMTECDTNNWCQLALAQPSSFPTCGYSPLDSNWHTFTVYWTASAISVSMDGQPTGCSFSAADGYIIPSTPMFLLIQTQTGGVGGTPNDSNLPAALQVSNVTVTQP
jgi:beta-glucanase (GH16 family)